MRTHQIHTENTASGYLARLAGADRNDRQLTALGISPTHAYGMLREQLPRELPGMFHASDRYTHVAETSEGLPPLAFTRSPNFQDNLRRAGDSNGCIVCGKAVQPGAPHIRMDTSGRAITDQYGDAHSAQDQGAFPIGPDCLRKNPQLRPYVDGGE